MVEIRRYTEAFRTDWDRLVEESINGTFLHKRDFIEYHGDKFIDTSVLVYLKNKPKAIFPANRIGGKVFSHQGLSYAGLILKKGVNFSEQKAIIEALLDFFRLEGVNCLEIKNVPTIYCKESQDSLEYLWMQNGAKILFSDLTYSIPLPAHRIGRTKRWKIRKSHLRQIEVKQSVDFKIFWEELLMPNLMQKYGVQPVHDVSEIILLSKLFPDFIKLYFAYEGNEILAGVCIFETERVAHAQYIVASPTGKKYKALDYLFNFLIQEKSENLAFFDFGRNVDSKSLIINESLLEWKESFGAQPFLQKTYLLEIEWPSK